VTKKSALSWRRRAVRTLQAIGDMKQLIVFLLALTAAVVNAANPTSVEMCEISSAVERMHLSPDKMAIRAGIFRELCKRSNGDLTDAEDPALKGRLAAKQARRRLDFTVTEDLQRKIENAKAPVILLTVSEANGQVSWITVLESSGDKQLDAAAVELTRAMDSPVTLDGKAVRLFRTIAQFAPAAP